MMGYAPTVNPAQQPLSGSSIILRNSKEANNGGEIQYSDLGSSYKSGITSAHGVTESTNFKNGSSLSKIAATSLQ